MNIWTILTLLSVWIAVASALAVRIGAAIRRRDEQRPGDRPHRHRLGSAHTTSVPLRGARR